MIKILEYIFQYLGKNSLVLISLMLGLSNFYIARRDRKWNQATKLVVEYGTEDDVHKVMTEIKDMKKSSVPMGFTLINYFQGAFTDIFLISVEDYHYDYKEIKSLKSSIDSGYYRYFKKMTETKKSFLISTGGSGMNKSPDIVILFTDSDGREWIKMPNNKIYRAKNYKEKLFEIGLDNPGYKSNGI